MYQHAKVEALHTKQVVFRAWSFATGKRNRADGASLTLSASLPFSTWDRMLRNYLDRGIVPSDQVYRGQKLGVSNNKNASLASLRTHRTFTLHGTPGIACCTKEWPGQGHRSFVRSRLVGLNKKRLLDVGFLRALYCCHGNDDLMSSMMFSQYLPVSLIISSPRSQNQAKHRPEMTKTQHTYL